MENRTQDALHQQLYRALLSLSTEEECRALLADLLTQKELTELSARLEVARLLEQGEVYQTIVSLTGASSATISRVSKCLTGRDGGYRTVLSRQQQDAPHNRQPAVLELCGLDDDTVAALTTLVQRLRGC